MIVRMPMMRFLLFGALLAAFSVVTFACSSSSIEEPVGETEKTAHADLDQVTGEEKKDWDTTAAFLAGVFTIANADSLDSTVFFENFRANYEWIKDVFLPHLKGTAEHNWWECDEYCVKTAKMLAKGDKEKEKELMEALSRYKIHERK